MSIVRIWIITVKFPFQHVRSLERDDSGRLGESREMLKFQESWEVF